jgi:hypothetical protein
MHFSDRRAGDRPDMRLKRPAGRVIASVSLAVAVALIECVQLERGALPSCHLRRLPVPG